MSVVEKIPEESLCKLVLYVEVPSLGVRAWDVAILVPNALLVAFLCFRFNRAQLKLRATNSPIFLAFYGLVWSNALAGVVRCVVSMTVDSSLADKALWIAVRFFLLAAEMSVVAFGLAFGHLDSRTSIKRVLLTTSAVSLAFTVAQGTLEIVLPDDSFHIASKDLDLFGHGGMLFWFCSSVVFALIYLCILLLPWTRLRERLALPTKLSFYVYILLLVLLNGTQAVGAGLINWDIHVGLCMVDVTTLLYFTLFTPLVYHTFLSEFFSVSQPSVMFSYKAQMDETVEDDQVSLPHQQSFSSLKTDSDYIYQNNSVYDSTVFETGGTTPVNPLYCASLQSPDSITSGQSVDVGGPISGYHQQNLLMQ